MRMSVLRQLSGTRQKDSYQFLTYCQIAGRQTYGIKVLRAGCDLVVVRQPKKTWDDRFCPPWTTIYSGQVKTVNENVPDMPRFPPFKYQFYKISPKAFFNNNLPSTHFFGVREISDNFGSIWGNQVQKIVPTDNHTKKLTPTLATSNTPILDNICGTPHATQSQQCRIQNILKSAS